MTDGIAKVKEQQQNINDSIAEVNEIIERAKDQENQRVYALKIKKEQEEKAQYEILRREIFLKNTVLKLVHTCSGKGK